MKELFSNPKEEEYLSEFKQKIAQEMQEDIERRRHELERSRNSFIGAIAGVVLAFGVSWFLLFPHFGFHGTKEIPIIRRPILPVKIQPSDPGGMEIENQDKTVYALVEKNEAEDTKVESLLPEPEQPKMPVITADLSEPVVDLNLPPKTMDELISSINTTATEVVKIPAKLPVIDVNVKKTNEPLTLKNDEKEEVKENKDNKAEEAKVSSLKPQVQETAKIETKAEKEKALEPVNVELQKNVAVAQKTATATSGSWCVQMMASNKKDAVEKGYETLTKQYAAIRGLPHRVEGGADGMWRLKVGAYGSKEQADDLCFKIKSAGGNCMVKEK